MWYNENIKIFLKFALLFGLQNPKIDFKNKIKIICQTQYLWEFENIK